MITSEQQEFWKNHSIAWKSSNLTQQEYCIQHDISYGSFVYQHLKLSREARGSKSHFIEAKPSGKSSNQSNSGLQLMLPNGVRIGITNEVDIMLLQKVLSLAGTLQC